MYATQNSCSPNNSSSDNLIDDYSDDDSEIRMMAAIVQTQRVTAELLTSAGTL